MRLTRFTTILLIILISVMVGTGVMAMPLPPPNPPDEGGGYELEPRCNIPGIVKNHSSRTIYIAADTEDSNGEWRYFYLPPGKTSNTHFRELCDADWMTLLKENFWWQMSFQEGQNVTEIRAGYWAPYLFNITWKCYNHSGYNNQMYCKPLYYNWH